MSETKRVSVFNMKVNVVGITRLLLHQYVENHLEEIIPKVKTYALNEYLSIQSDGDYEQLLLDYQQRLGVETVHVDDDLEFCEGLIEIIEGRDSFRQILKKYDGVIEK